MTSRPPPLLNVDDTNKVISQLRAVGNVDLAVVLEASLAKQAEATKQAEAIRSWGCTRS